MSRTIVPFGRPAQLTGPIVAVAIASLGAARWLTLQDAAARAELRRWLLVLAAGVAVIAVGYAPYLLSHDFQPLSLGLHDRVNVVPSIGFAIAVCALIAIAVRTAVAGGGRVLAAGGGRAVSPGGVLAATAAIVIGIGYTISIRDDARRWDEAASLQRQTVAAVVDAVSALRSPGRSGRLRGASIYVFDQYAFAAPGVPVFNESDDLDAALKARLGDRGQHAYATLPGALFYCERSDIWMETGNVALDDDYGNVDVGDFGHTIFVDVRRRRATLISDSHACDAALRTFLPGPLLPAG
jgi:hypothetical protein